MIMALVGFADSTFLAVEHYRGVIPPCSANEGCEKVLSSQYSAVFGVPTALFGSLYYLAVSLGSFIYLESRHGRGSVAAHHAAILKWTMLATVLGFVMSLWFVYLQLFILRSICIYCMGSAATSTVLFIAAATMLKKYSAADRPPTV
jgi:uncharacterized membrane protein